MRLLDFTDAETQVHIRAMLIDGEPWFVAKDVCHALGIENSRQALRRLDDDERNTVISNDGNRGNPNLAVVNESGLYALILTSRKPEAKRFRRWVTSEVLPAIREKGFYSVFPETEDAAKLRLEARVAGQMSRIRSSVENLREPLPPGYGSVSALLKSFGLTVTPGELLTVGNKVRALARQRDVRVVPVWQPDGWRAVNQFPRELVREAATEVLPGHQPHPDLFEGIE